MIPFCNAVLDSYKQFCWDMSITSWPRLAPLRRAQMWKMQPTISIIMGQERLPLLRQPWYQHTHTQYQSNCGSRHYISRRREWRRHGCRGSFWQKHINIHDRCEKYAKDSRANWCNGAIWGWTERKGVKDGGRKRKRRKCVLEGTSPPASQTVVLSK